MTTLSWFTHPRDVPDLNDFLSSMEQGEETLKRGLVTLFHAIPEDFSLKKDTKRVKKCHKSGEYNFILRKSISE